MNVYEDRTQEEILKLVKEFKNLIDTYNLWRNGTVAEFTATIYADFRCCLRGNARDMWDIIISNQPRTAAQFQVQLKKLIKKHIGQTALQNQVLYLEMTRKPENMLVLQWINCINNINVYLPLLADNAVKLTEYELATKVVARNIPPSWVRPFHMMKLHLKESIDDILDELLIIEDQYKEQKLSQQKQVHGKQLKNPCHLHKGGHEWSDCHENPKNKRNNEQANHDNNQDNRNRQNGNHSNNNRRSNNEEHRNTESGNEEGRSNRHHQCDEDSDYESNCILVENHEKIPSAEIIITVPKDKGHKQYKTYLGLVDTGTSSSLINKEIVELSSFDMTISQQETKWITQAGTFKTDGKVKLENYFLPQFTNKRKITSEFHMFEKSRKDAYDLIIGWNILSEIWLNILYDTHQFEWNDIKVNMVPGGHWSKENISSFWKKFKAAQEE